MVKLVRLYSAAMENGGTVDEKTGHLDKKVMMVYTGKFESMDGPVEIKDEDIEKLVSNHNAKFAKLSRLADGQPDLKNCPPLQLDHSTSARDTVGRLVGELSVGQYQPDGGVALKAMYGTARFLGKDNIEKVQDGRWSHVSMGADLEKHELSELTVTPFPAAANASLLAAKKLAEEKNKPEGKMTHKEMSEKMSEYAKCKKHLMDEKKMSEEDADKHLESAPDDEKKKLAQEHDDKEAKMAKEANDEKDKELKRMAGFKDHKAKMIALKKGMVEQSGKIQLAQKRLTVVTRLTKLRADGKVTPAEIKSLNIEELSGKSDEVINAALQTYEKREPVIDPGLYGTTKALTASQLQSRLKGINMHREELQTRLNMPSKREEALKQLKELDEKEAEFKRLGLAVPGEHQPGGGGEEAKFEALWGHMKGLLDGGKHDEAKEHLRKHLAGMPVGPDGTEQMGGTGVSDPTPQMAALAEGMKKMQTEFDEIVKLTAPVFGITAEELV